MSDALEALLAEEKAEGLVEGKILTIADMIKDNAITLDYVKSSGKYSPSEIEQIEAALKQN